MTDNTGTLVKNRTETHPAESTRNGTYFTPRVDILETEAELLLFADLPGVRSEGIDLNYENGELILRGKVAPATARGNLIFGEYDVGDYYRVFQVHETIDSSRIDAEFKNGVLTVRLPKQEAAKPKQVQIRTQA
jgi:HSP20 family protein